MITKPRGNHIINVTNLIRLPSALIILTVIDKNSTFGKENRRKKEKERDEDWVKRKKNIKKANVEFNHTSPLLQVSSLGIKIRTTHYHAYIAIVTITCIKHEILFSFAYVSFGHLGISERHIIGRNPVSPPELAGNTPIPTIVQPIVPSLVMNVWN